MSVCVCVRERESLCVCVTNTNSPHDRNHETLSREFLYFPTSVTYQIFPIKI